ncbi:MAG: hypothetical protein ACPL4K_04765, partial [Candidatus Margulisiibacteriota bacterium]
MSDFGSTIERIYHRISDLLFSPPTYGCAGGPNENCLATGSIPQAGAIERDFAGEYDVSDPNRPEVI